MKILYHTWGEWMRSDVVEALISLGHEVTVDEKKLRSYDDDEEYAAFLSDKLRNGYDMVFTMDYFPIISEVCSREDRLYLSWISDCPHLPLFSKTVTNPCNRIFCFDRTECDDLLARGANAYSLPLGVNIKRLEKTALAKENYLYDVSFLGSFYQDDYNHLEKIEHMPPRLKGYIDGISEAQMHIYGYDLIGEAFDENKAEELSRVAMIDLGEGYESRNSDIFRDWIRKNVTILEREAVMKRVAERFKLSIATDKLPDSLKKEPNIEKLGYADYYKDMPVIFRRSRINLNLSLRSIISGIPLRVTDILGAGGFVITNYQPELSLYFENGKDIVWFDSHEQLLELIDYYLTHDAERESVREKGYEAACSVFSYPRLLGILLDAAI